LSYGGIITKLIARLRSGGDRTNPAPARERSLLMNQMSSMSAKGQVAAGARLQAIAQETAAMYARATGRKDWPPPADAASWA
jgi:hypothetical protein